MTFTGPSASGRQAPINRAHPTPAAHGTSAQDPPAHQQPGTHDVDDSMPALTDDDGTDNDDEEEEEDDYGVDMADLSQRHNSAPMPPRRSAPRSISTQPAHGHRQDELESHPAGSSIDDIDIELPLVQDEYASSEEALEGTSGGDEDMPSLMQDELASSGSDVAGSDSLQPRHGRRSNSVAQARIAAQTAAVAAEQPGDVSPSLSSASSMTARTLLDPAQACGPENLPNKRLKREGTSFVDSPRPASGMTTVPAGAAGKGETNHSRLSAEAAEAAQPDRSFGGPITWARRGAGALTSWALGMAGLR